MSALLQSLGLDHLEDSLHRYGVKSVADMSRLTAADVDSIVERPLERRKLLEATKSFPARPVHVRALVVGCGDYISIAELDNPASDALAVAAVLEAAGAEVLLLLNPSRAELEDGLKRLGDPMRKPFPAVLKAKAESRSVSLKKKPHLPSFLSKAAAALAPAPAAPAQKRAPSDNVVGLLFFAGHGMEVGGENLLVPVDFDTPADAELAKLTTESQQTTLIKDHCLPLRDALALMNRAEFFVSIALLDCCRDWPLGAKLPKPVGRTGGGTRGGMSTVDKSALSAREGSIIAFATKDGQARFVSSLALGLLFSSTFLKRFF